MDPRTVKSSKKTYFASPKKEPLVRRMILDPNQANIPTSYYEPRPIHENESNQQDIIFDPKSSSLKEISEFDKNSPHELDKMIYGHNENSIQNEAIYIDSDRGANSPQYNPKSHEESLSLSENSNPRKRDNPVSHEETRKYENIDKILQISEKQNQSGLNGFNIYFSENLQNKIEFFDSPVVTEKVEKQKTLVIKKGHKKLKRSKGQIHSFLNQDRICMSDEKEKRDHLHVQIYNSNNSQDALPQVDNVKIEEISQQINVVDLYMASEKKTVRKRVDNPEFQLINQYMELASYAALIDEMILVYDKSPLFEFPLDFDSQTDEDDEDQEKSQIQNQQAQKSQNKMDQQGEVKIEHVEKQKPQNNASKRNQNISKSQKELYDEFEKLKLSQAADEKEKQKIIKEINFNRSKTYYNFYEPVKQLRPYMKKMTIEEKKLFLAFKKEIKEIKDIIDYFERKNQGDKKQHICKICGEEFESGRQLGGHMSRKHPGKAIEYGFKRELHKVKEIERNRRKYFKFLENEVKLEHKEK